MKYKVSVFCFFILSICTLHAEVYLPKIFNSHMVLQRHKPIPVWGWADAGEEVTIELSGDGLPLQIKTVVAGNDRNWMLRLDAENEGGPYSLTVKGKENTIVLNDVLIGEVWICSGQSNMQWPVRRSNNAEKEIATANYPQIRHFDVPREMSLSPRGDLSGGKWKAVTLENIGNFTAVGYFFGRELHRQLGVPIGLIHSSWGGTIVETWISREGMESFNEFSDALSSMPTSIEEFGARRREKLNETIRELQGGLPEPEEVQLWASASFDDSSWKAIDLPRYFDHGKLLYHDGAVWFRREFDLPDSLSGQSMALSLGTIDDIDDTYINGVKAGSSSSKSTAGRTYILDASKLRPGRNVIAVRVDDLGGKGGITGKPEDMKISLNTYEQSLAGTWKYRIETSVDNKQFISPNDAGTLLYNSMIAPLIPYAMQGVIWYQGESNAIRAHQYRKSFPLMIKDWRDRWQETFPFLFVQLSSFDAAGGNSIKGSSWAELREAQDLTLRNSSNTGMAVIHDIGDPKDIHPGNKQEVGRRLSLLALSMVYGSDTACRGPQFESMQKEERKIVLSFSHTGSGLTAHDKYGYLHGFEIAGADRKFFWAKAEIHNNKVIVWNDEVADPVAVRYAWADNNIEANLFNMEGLPASPFRTDTWRGVTEEARFK